MKTHELLIEKDLDIRKAINGFVMERGWETAYISGAIGSVKNVCLSTPKTKELPPVLSRMLVEGPGEILAFTGEILKKENMDPVMKQIYPDDGSPLFIHIHASLAIAGGQVFGGGFQGGEVFRCLKVYIQQV